MLTQLPLFCRRSVSNLLSSEFRESLDQLIESYVQRQEQNPFDWDLQMSPAAGSIEADQGQQRDDLVQDQISVSVTPPTLPSPPVPPPPPPRPLWHSTLRHTNWTRQSFQHSVNSLPIDLQNMLLKQSKFLQILIIFNIQDGNIHMRFM